MRTIDLKFHVEGDRIIKTTNGVPVPEDEPLFLVRARDHNALAMLQAYRDICVADKCTQYQMDGIDAAIARFTEFKRRNPAKMKQPGVTLGK